VQSSKPQFARANAGSAAECMDMSCGCFDGWQIDIPRADALRLSVEPSLVLLSAAVVFMMFAYLFITSFVNGSIHNGVDLRCAEL
jgi:hypothetical protein